MKWRERLGMTNQVEEDLDDLHTRLEQVAQDLLELSLEPPGLCSQKGHLFETVVCTRCGEAVFYDEGDW